MTTKTANNNHLKNAINQQQQGAAQTAVSPFKKAETYLKKMEPVILQALPKNSGMTPERLSRITLTTMKTNPKLQECTTESILAAVLQSAQLGLEPDLMGSCYFIPYNQRNGQPVASFQIGYRGLIDLVTRRGEVTSITANPVYENDFWVFEYGRNEDLRHRPANYSNRGRLIGFYAYAHLKNGGFKMHYMDVEEIEHIRNEHSKAFKYDQKTSIWVKHYDAMAKKTVIKQLIKYLPISVEIQNAIAHDETVRKDITDIAQHVDIEDPSGETYEQEILDPQPENN